MARAASSSRSVSKFFLQPYVAQSVIEAEACWALFVSKHNLDFLTNIKYKKGVAKASFFYAIQKLEMSLPCPLKIWELCLLIELTLMTAYNTQAISDAGVVAEIVSLQF